MCAVPSLESPSPCKREKQRPRPARANGQTPAPHKNGGGSQGERFHGGPPPEPSAAVGRWSHTKLAARKQRSPLGAGFQRTRTGPLAPRGYRGSGASGPCKTKASLLQTKTVGDNRQRSESVSRPAKDSPSAKDWSAAAGSWAAPTAAAWRPDATRTPRGW
jgi:hypothetical protein